MSRNCDTGGTQGQVPCPTTNSNWDARGAGWDAGTGPLSQLEGTWIRLPKE